MSLRNIFILAFLFFSTALFAQKRLTQDEMQKMLQEERARIMAIKGTSITPFSLNDLNNNPVSSEKLKGKIYVLNFWFVGCKPCVMEMPELNKLVEKYKTKDIIFIALAVDKADDVRKFLKKHQFDYNILPDARSVILKDFQIHTFPTHIIVDRDNKVRYYLSGYSPQSIAALDKNINTMLIETP